MLRRMPLLLVGCVCAASLYAQNLQDIEVHVYVTQGFLFSSNNNYLTMQSSSGSLQWTDGAVSVADSLTNKLRVGIQLHMYQMGQLGGPNVMVDWASGDYKFNDYFGIRAGKIKTVLGLFNDYQDVDAIFLWVLLPQGFYQVDNRSTTLAHTGGDVYGSVPLGSRGGTVRYNGHVGETSIDLNSGLVKLVAEYGLIFTTPPAGKSYGGDLRWETPLKGLMIGSSMDVQAIDGTGPGTSLHVHPMQISAQYAQFTKGKFYFAGEYDRTPVSALMTAGPVSFPYVLDRRAWFAMGSYRVWKKLQVGSYYSHYVNKSADTTLPANYSKDWVVSGRYDFNAYFYGKIEGHFQRGNGLGYYSSTNPDGLKPNSNMLAAKIGFSF